ncbi:MAG TPA: glycerophosphodiester phosphodiesterase family protein [Puia sp.]|nr:glycerophosphodiester phosphodiesterase family protein [Puia sp.]
MHRLFKFFEIGICLISYGYINAQTLKPLPAIRHNFIVVAHRGDHTHAPENTLKAFENAILDSADYVEIDLRTSLDSQLIIMHDASVDRMTDGKGFVKDMNLESLKKLRVQDKVHPERGEAAVATFKEVLQLCKGRINIYLDFKNAEPAVAYKEIIQSGMEKQVIVYINEEEQYYKWRKTAPDMPLMVSLPDHIRDVESMKNFLEKYQVEILDGDYDQYSVDMIRTVGQLGYLVVTDIQGMDEAPAKWNLAIEKGIRGLQTDHPKELIDYLSARGIR